MLRFSLTSLCFFIKTNNLFVFYQLDNLKWLQNMYEEASQVASDAVNSIRTVASFCAEEKVMKLYKKKCEGPIKAGIRQGLMSGIGFGLSFFFFFMAYAVTFYVGAKLVDHKQATFTEVFRVCLHLKYLCFYSC